MQFPSKLGYVLLSIGVGGTIGGALWCLAKRHYEKWAIDKINENDDEWINKMDERIRQLEAKDDMIDMLVREVYELRTACKIMLDENACEAIFEQVKYKMKDVNEADPSLRQSVEDLIVICQKWLEQKQKVIEKAQAEAISDSLGYGSESGDPPQETRLYGDEKREAMRREAESHMDDGRDQFDDMPPLTPNGDIDDSEGDEYESPSEAMSDTVEWTTDAGIYVSGDDIKKDSPYVITEWQWTYGRREYAKISLEYYCEDDTVLDEDDTELDQSFIGPENLRAFETDDCESIFIRNDQYEVDYEIMWVEGSYIHDVLGYPETITAGLRRIYRSWERNDGK